MINPIDNRTIIIGCDELSHLSIILNALSQPAFENYSFLTFSRQQQLLQAVHSNKTTLVILCSNSNQQVLNALFDNPGTKNIPLFCFTNANQGFTLEWPNNANVFTYPLREAIRESSIATRISSVLSLSNTAIARNSQSFVPQQNGNVGVQDLSRYALELDQKNAILDRVKMQVETIALKATPSVRSNLKSVLVMIRQAKTDQRYWSEFKEYFNRLNPGFFQTLSQKHPSLTAKDLKYCCYLRMNLSNNEITRLMGISQESVRTHKYRLKKKMALSKEQNLEHYLIRVNGSQARVTA